MHQQIMLHLQRIKVVHDFEFNRYCKIAVLWCVTPLTRSVVDKFPCVGRTCCLRLKFRQFSSNLKMEAACFPETLVQMYRVIRRYKLTVNVIPT
jgi:hypothetical protein